jgi:hypothetical protein
MAYTTIDDPSEYFQTAIYSGNSSTLAVTSQGNAIIAPDWVWVKRRNSTSTHALVDSSRGRAKSLGSESNESEYNTSDTAKDLISFDTNGFTVGPANQRNMNGNGDTFVAWQWKANGGTTSSNTDGSITTTVQANTTAGFSIVTYTGNATNGATIGHGLGAVPQVIIKKNRSSNSREWNVYHHSIGNTKSLFLNTSEAETTESAYNNTSPTSSIQTINGSGANNGDGDNMIAYFFTPIKGYSKFGSYTGNGNADGTFVYTGFKPAWILFKNISTGDDNWTIVDNKRDIDNPTTHSLFPSGTNAEDDGTGNGYINVDFVSNGFKIRQITHMINASSENYIYMAFAENPFVSSKGVPTTAR